MQHKVTYDYFTLHDIFSLLEKGRQMLMKDNLIDEDKAKQEEAAQENLVQKIDRLHKVSSKRYIIYQSKGGKYFKSYKIGKTF